MAEVPTLDIGCGMSKEPGAIGLDQFALPGVDLVCNLNAEWPVETASIGRVIFRHSIVHLQSLEHALREARRVCHKDGIIEIISPHFSSDNAFTDPTMNFATGYRTMDYYCANGSMGYGYYGRLGLRILHQRIHLYRSEPRTRVQRLLQGVVSPFDAIVNAMPRIYEKFFCFVFRANEVRFLLRAE